MGGVRRASSTRRLSETRGHRILIFRRGSTSHQYAKGINVLHEEGRRSRRSTCSRWKCAAVAVVRKGDYLLPGTSDCMSRGGLVPGQGLSSSAQEESAMPGLLEGVDPDGLLEFSVVYSDRALNHMSKSFQGVMRDISAGLKRAYGADAVAVIPGSGTYGMEAVARQFATGKEVVVIRNGWFSYRWTQIFDAGHIPANATVLKARRVSEGAQAPFAPPPIEEVVATIREKKPDVVFAPHVETSAGLILPQDYITQVAEAAHAVGGIFVLDCIASGAVWVDMKETGVDVVISAPQKTWSSSACAGLVMLSQRAKQVMEGTTSSSFTIDLKKWLQVMEAYEKGGHMYHATMPTDSLKRFRDIMQEMEEYGLQRVKEEQIALGEGVRSLLESRGFPSVAAEGFKAPGVVVSYTSDADISSGKKFLAEGVQIAAGVPLQCDEGSDFRTFRIGLFGLEKLHHHQRTVGMLGDTLGKVAGQ